jgi:hypothetical protein
MLNKTDEGKRVELVRCDDPYTKLKTGDKGTYEWRSEVDMGDREVMIQHAIKWDNGSNLMLVQEFGRNAKTHDSFKFI